MRAGHRILLGSIVIVIMGAACDLWHEPGPMPSDIIETEFEPGLNIFGVLRQDDQPGSSYFYIERAYQYQELDTLELDESFIPIISDAQVFVQGRTDTTTYLFTHEIDSLLGNIYSHDEFIPVAGEQYNLTIYHEDFPILTDTTVCPDQPTLIEDSVMVFGQDVIFGILTTADTYMYEVYLISDTDSLHYRYVNYAGDGVLPVFFTRTGDSDEPFTIHVYGYDANLADYLTAMITFKPQTYLELVTTVTDGYGAFGSVSVLKKTILP